MNKNQNLEVLGNKHQINVELLNSDMIVSHGNMNSNHMIINANLSVVQYFSIICAMDGLEQLRSKSICKNHSTLLKYLIALRKVAVEHIQDT